MLNNKRERSEKEEDASIYKKKLLDMLNNELKSDESMMNDLLILLVKTMKIIRFILRL